MSFLLVEGKLRRWEGLLLSSSGRGGDREGKSSLTIRGSSKVGEGSSGLGGIHVEGEGEGVLHSCAQFSSNLFSSNGF